MAFDPLSTTKKALSLNLDSSIYGTFAEIGAGQETARQFFLAGKASQTVAKTMSAYDMTFSDTIYGEAPGKRYVCEDRLLKMLDHEYQLLIDRLGEERGDRSQFFAFANTVSGRTERNKNNCHAWMGVRFQMGIGTEPNDFIIHVRMLDERRLDQQQALGTIGVNLLHAAYSYMLEPELIVPALMENLGKGRVEIDMIRLQGPGLRHINSRLMSLELMLHGMTNAMMFSPDGKVLQPSDELYGKPIFVQRGTFRPVTKTNVEILEKGVEQFKSDPDLKDNAPVVAMEITMQSLEQDGQIDREDFLERIDTLAALGHRVLITNCLRYYELKAVLRKYTREMIGMVVGASEISKLYGENFYEHLEGGTLEATSLLFDSHTKLYVYPLQKDGQFISAQSYPVPEKWQHLHQHLLSSGSFVDIQDCDKLGATMLSQDVRDLMAKGDPSWENMVPEAARAMIKARGFFGWKKAAS